MAIEFYIEGWDEAGGLKYIRQHIQLQEGNRWKRANKSTDVSMRGKFPAEGTWGRMHTNAGPGTPLNNSLVLHGGGSNLPIVVLGKFFPAETGKTGGGRIGNLDLKLPGGEARYKIIEGMKVVKRSFAEKFAIAFKLARSKAPELLPAEIWNTITDPKFIAFLALHMVKRPWAWFKLLKSVASKALYAWMIVDYAYTFNSIIADIDMADNDDQLRAAGMRFAQLLARLGADLSFTAVTKILEGVRNMMDGGKVESPVPERVAEGKKPRKAGELPPEEGHVKPKTPELRLHGWREGYRKLLALAVEYEQMAENSKTPAQYVYFKERAVGARLQAVFLKHFIIETVQHMSWMKKVCPDVNAYSARVRDSVAKKGGYGPAAEKFQAECRQQGMEISREDALRVVKTLDQAGSNMKWNLHDVERELTSKLNEIVSHGLKHPINVRDLRDRMKWSLEHLDMACKGINPDTGKMFTMAEIQKMFPANADELLAAYGRASQIFVKGHKETGQSVGVHNHVDHHQHKRPEGWSDERWAQAQVESGTDTAHAMLQDRGYNKGGRSTVADVTKKNGNPFVKLGIVIFSKYDRDSYSAPRNTTRSMLDAYEVGDLASELSNL